MAALATMTMGEINKGKKEVYPLFQRDIKQINPDLIDSQELPKKTTELTTAPKQASQTKKRSKKTASSKNNGELISSGEGGHTQANLLEVDPNDGRRKRRKTDSPRFKDSLQYSGDDGAVGTSTVRKYSRERMPPHSRKSLFGSLNQSLMAEGGSESSQGQNTVSTNADSSRSTTANISQTPEVRRTQESEAIDGVSIVNDNKIGLGSSTTETVETKPRKLLKWNPKTGTIGSPPKKALPFGNVVEKQSSTSTTSKASRLKSKIVDIQYGRNKKFSSQVRQKILDILNTPPEPIALTANATVKAAPPKPAKTTPMKHPKPLHPLFGGEKASTTNKNESTKNSLLPVEVSKSRNSRESSRPTAQPLDRPKTPPKKKEGLMFSAFGGSSGLLKFPGAVEPAWPWQGMVHVRGTEHDCSQSTEADKDTTSQNLHQKRAKYSAVAVQEDEQVISVLSSTLDVKNVAKAISETRPNEFSDVPHCLRVPTKHYEGGSALQERVRRKIKSALPVAKFSPANRNTEEANPALARVYEAIPSSLSAFDQGKCEVQAWTQKYSPSCASEVLQGGGEPAMLRNWLQTLTIQSVETADKSSQPGSKRDSQEKRKRKSKKLDGFVVSSDEEDDDLDEITDPEDEASDFGGSTFLKKTAVRAGDVAAMESGDRTKLRHVVVLSGPHGCGKTATVFAIAKELGFEVFEINPGSRRNGNDITEKVGDMTQNHLVQHSKVSSPLDEDSLRIDQALAKDLESGRQGTMKSFFETKGSTNPKSVPAKASTLKKSESKKTASVTKPPSKHQKQSLILIEEADIIFEEDKAFWATVLKLIAQTKRPIIITCNDESSIPLLSLSLHGVFRFRPAPTDLAVDYLLLVAACEGHVIQRDAVTSLYNSRNSDLRASLTDLNYWCQFAVGDVKNGLDWFYPRWPIGKDVDHRGETIRVVSEGTYEAGMGGFSQDVLESYGHYLDVEEEILHEAWDGWGLDAGDWHDTVELDSWASKMKDISDGQNDARAALHMYEEFAESMSVADLSSANAFAMDSMTLMETDQPSAKAREDHIQAFALMGLSPKEEFRTVSKDISTWMKCRARKYLQEDQHIRHGFEIQEELNCPSETQLNQMVIEKVINPNPGLSRPDFSLAFDPIAESENTLFITTAKLEASSFDRSFNLIPLDIAPYVRSIVAYDARLQQDRARLSNLLSEGGSKSKRRRTTRAAMSALEGGARKTTRKDRYFGTKLNAAYVMHTGMTSWTEAAGRVTELAVAEAPATR